MVISPKIIYNMIYDINLDNGVKIMSNRKHNSTLKLVSRYVTKILKDDIFGLSAEMAFYLLTAFFPFIILLFIIATNVSEQMQNLLLNLIHALPTDAEEIIMSMLLNFTGSITIVVTSAFLALWCTSNVINTVKKALNRFYGINETRSFLETRLMSLFFALIIILIIILSFALIIFGEGTGILLRYLNYFSSLGAQRVWNRSRYIVIICVFLVSISAMFKVLPNKRLKLSSVIGGSALTTAAWCVASWGFAFYVNNFSRYHVIYGSLAGVIILTTWVYMSGFVILAGGELNAFLYKTRMAKRLRNLHKKKLAEENRQIN